MDICPVRHAGEIHSDFTSAYAGWAKSDGEIVSSSSGGFCSILSRNFIENGGIVYGVVYHRIREMLSICALKMLKILNF